jgi:uncharacterized membrane protein YeaQ/YmgE (transglycosylase-associated protein family)
MINNIDDRIVCPACAKNINVMSRRCPHCTTTIDTVAEYIIVPGSVKSTIIGLISAFIAAFLIAGACDKFDVSGTHTIVACILGAFVVDWRIRRHGIGRKLVTSVSDGLTSINQR